MTNEGALLHFLESVEKGFLNKETGFNNYISWLKTEGLFEIDRLPEYKAEFGFEINTASEQEEGVSQWDLSLDRDSDFKVAISNGWVSDDFIDSLLY